MQQSAPPPPTQSGALLEGFRFLARRPLWTAGLVLLGTLLGQLGPALEILAKAGKNPIVTILFGGLALLPFELYFIPRWISRLDADLLDSPSNALERWPGTFDQRWLQSSSAKILVQTLGSLGSLLIVPGVVIFSLAGFAPTRMLLRGESFSDSLRWNAHAMARHWPRIIQSAIGILIVILMFWLALSMARYATFIQFGVEGPDAWTRLKHPFEWALHAITALVAIWSSASFLSLYQRLEKLAAGDAAGQSPSK